MEKQQDLIDSYFYELLYELLEYRQKIQNRFDAEGITSDQTLLRKLSLAITNVEQGQLWFKDTNHAAK